MLLDQYGKQLTPEIRGELMRPERSRSRGAPRRLHARYDAAQDTSENRKHWQWADNYSASAANSIEVRRKLRSRSRYECIEANSFAKGMALTLANDTISTGPSIQCLGDRVVGAFIEREWRKWARAVGLAKKLRTARLSKVVDGEVFLLKTTNRRLRTPVQLDVKLIEADQISTPGFVDGMPNRIDGIEFDKWGAPATYHMLKGHPGDIWAMGAWEKEDIDPSDMIHLFRVDRPGQVRGIPEFTPALPLFAFLRRVTLATIAASETAANFSAVLETAANAFDEEEGYADEFDPFEQVEIDRNMMTSLPRGWKMTQFKPEQPTTNYEMFRNAILNEIARCVHMPRNKALADSSAYNYSSGRLDHQTYYESIGVERSEWETECLDRIFEWWLDEALMLSNYLPIGGILDDMSHEWRWNPPRHVEPGKEINAAIDAIAAGLMSEERYLLEQNIDPEVHYAQLERQARRKARLAAIGAGTSTGGVSMIGEVEPSVDDEGNPLPAAKEPTGEMANLNRRQMQNNTKAIDDVLEKLRDGTYTERRTRIALRQLDQKEQTINDLIDDVLMEIGE